MDPPLITTQPLPVKTPVQPMPEAANPGQVQQTQKANRPRAQTANKNGASSNPPARANLKQPNYNSSVSWAI